MEFLYKVALNKESAFVNDLFDNSSFSKRIAQDLRNQNTFASFLLSTSIDKLKSLPLDATLAVVKNFKERGDSSTLIAGLISKFPSKVSYIIDKEQCLNALLTSVMSITSMGTRELSLVCILESIIRINKSLSEGHLETIQHIIENMTKASSPATLSAGFRIAKLSYLHFKESLRANIAQTLSDRVAEIFQSNNQNAKNFFSVLKTYIISLDANHFSFIVEEKILGELTQGLRYFADNNMIEQIILVINFMHCIFQSNLKRFSKSQNNMLAEKRGLLDLIENLQNHQDSRVRSLSYRTLSEDFELDD